MDMSIISAKIIIIFEISTIFHNSLDHGTFFKTRDPEYCLRPRAREHYIFLFFGSLVYQLVLWVSGLFQCSLVDLFGIYLGVWIILSSFGFIFL